MKIQSALFLDIDGVLNNYHMAEENRDQMFTQLGRGKGDLVCDYKLKMFKKIIKLAERRGIELTIYGVSSWFGPDFDRTKLLFSCCGIEIEEKLATVGCESRGRSVLDKLVEVKPTYFAILDDCKHFYPNVIGHPFYTGRPYYDIQQHIVSPHGRYGITDHEFERLEQLLGLTDEEYTGYYSPSAVQERYKKSYGHTPYTFKFCAADYIVRANEIQESPVIFRVKESK